MYAVCVTFTVEEGRMDDFLPLVERNARTSRTEEPGCHRFDVATDPERPNEVFLYELYEDRAAFDAHHASDHFAAFDAASPEMVAGKEVRKWARVVS